MLDSLLTLNKRGAFWLIGAFFVSLFLHAAVVALTGVQEPIFLLAAAAVPLVLLVTGCYTLLKRATGPHNHVGHT
jgi:hypothetical protein